MDPDTESKMEAAVQRSLDEALGNYADEKGPRRGDVYVDELMNRERIKRGHKWENAANEFEEGIDSLQLSGMRNES